MHRRNYLLGASAALSLAMTACVAEPGEEGDVDVGSATIALTRAPSDATCLRVTVTASARNVNRLIDLKAGEASVYRLEGLPVGQVTFKGDAFSQGCAGVFAGSTPSWYSDPVSVRLSVTETVNVVLKMMHNGRASVSVNFDEGNGAPGLANVANKPATFSSQTPYLVPVAAGVQTKAILTVGDSANPKPDGTPYKMVGIPDGLGAFDNGDGSFTLLANQELTNTVGINRAHGAKGAFVSKWIVRKSDLGVLSGEDLMTQVVSWNPATSSYAAPAQGVAFSRFCSADLAPRSAWYDSVSGLGYDGRLFTDGEESGVEGRAVAHALDGTSYELPRLGKFAFENVVANPGTGTKTVVVGTDDGQGGQVYVYLGEKLASGSPVERAGLTNGKLFGIKVPGIAVEDAATGIASGSFEVAELGNVENLTGAQLDAASNVAGVTSFLRPEDGAWDPSNPNDFYFVTTASFTGNSRLWRLRFNDAANPEAGGRIDMLLDGSEGQKMMDNIAIDRRGHIIIVEDVGNQDFLGRVLRYDIATDTLTVIAQHDPARFTPGAAGFLTKDEEASGVIDASDLLGDGWFLLDVQGHYATDTETVEGGQFLAIFDPATKL